MPPFATLSDDDEWSPPKRSPSKRSPSKRSPSKRSPSKRSPSKISPRLKDAHAQIDHLNPTVPTVQKKNSQNADLVYMLALGAGIAVAAAGVTATGPLAPATMGAVAAVGFSISFMIRWMRTLKIDDSYIQLLDYMYAHARYIQDIQKKYVAYPYLQDVVVRVGAIVAKLRNSTFNQEPVALLRKPSMAQRFSTAVNSTLRRLKTGKLWVTTQDINNLQNLITTSAHELEFLMDGVILFVGTHNLKLDEIQFNFYLTVRQPDLSAFKDDSIGIQPDSHLVGGKRKKTKRR